MIRVRQGGGELLHRFFQSEEMRGGEREGGLRGRVRVQLPVAGFKCRAPPARSFLLPGSNGPGLGPGN